MGKITNTLLRLGAFVLLLLGLTGTALAQDIYVAPGGTTAATLTSECTANDPCQLAWAVQNATAGSVIAVRQGTYTSADYDDMTVNVGANMAFRGWVDADGAEAPAKAQLSGAVQLNVGVFDTDPAKVAAATPATLVLTRDFVLSFTGSATVNLANTSAITSVAGPDEFAQGTVIFEGAGTSQIRVPTNEHVATIHNLQIDRSGTVGFNIILPTVGEGPAVLEVTRTLDVQDGTLNLNEHVVRLVADPDELDGDDDQDFANDDEVALIIAEDAEIAGNGQFEVRVQPSVRPFIARGTGEINATFILQESLADSDNDNPIDNVFYQTAIGGDDVSVIGLGQQVEADPGGNSGWTLFPNLTSIEGGLRIMNQSTVLFQEFVTIDGDLFLESAGARLILDETTLAEGDLGATTVTGDFVVNADGARVDLTAGADRVHNLAIQGDLLIEQAPIIALEDLGDVYEIEPSDNRVILNGSRDQDLVLNDLLELGFLEVNKPSGTDVEIDEASSSLLAIGGPNAAEDYSTIAGPVGALWMNSGDLITNGKLDARLDIVVINWTSTSRGQVLAGDAPSAYVDDEGLTGPNKVQYTGDVAIFTGDELPGSAEGGALETLTIALSEPDPVVTLGKDLTLSQSLELLRGNLDVGSSTLTFVLGEGFSFELGDEPVPNEFSQRFEIVVGDGNLLVRGGPPNLGQVVFPTVLASGDRNSAYIAGEDGIELTFVNTDERTVSLEWPTGSENALNVITDVRVQTGSQINLRQGETFRVNDDVAVLDGLFNVNGATLEISADNSGSTTVIINEDVDTEGDADDALGQLTDTRLDSLGFSEGLVRFIGSELTEVGFGTVVDGLLDGEYTQLEYTFPATEIDKVDDDDGDDGKEPAAVGFFARGMPSTDRVDNLDVVTILGDFTIVNASNPRSHQIDEPGGVIFAYGLDQVNVLGDFVQQAGQVLMWGITDLRGDDYFKKAAVAYPTEFTQWPIAQLLNVGGDFTQSAGDFFMYGSNVTVAGDFTLGAETSAALFSNSCVDDLFGYKSSAASKVSMPAIRCYADFLPEDDFEAMDDFFATRRLEQDFLNDDVPLATLSVGGAFTVEENIGEDDTELNRLILGDGWIRAAGDVTFLGSGDEIRDNQEEDQGLRGTFVFTGEGAQAFTQRQDPDAYLNEVTLFTEGPVELQNDMWINGLGELTLRFGNIDTDDDEFEVIILNPDSDLLAAVDQDGDIIGARNNADLGLGTVELGSRDSYVDGPVTRAILGGQATGGVVFNGFLFPVGEDADTTTVINRDVFAPLVLQFSTPGRTTQATTTLLSTDEEVEPILEGFEPFSVETSAGPRTLNLNVLADFVYRVEFDEIPSEDPNLRIVADFLPAASVRDIGMLRIVQLPCEPGAFAPRLAGTYDIVPSSPDDPSALLNDFINGVPNVIQEGVDVQECQYFVVATDQFINPINVANPTADFAEVQLIHAAPGAGAVDVTIEGFVARTDWAYGEATPFLRIPIDGDGVQVLIAGADTVSQTVSLSDNQSYVLVVAENADGTVVPIVVENARQEARNQDMVEVVAVDAEAGVEVLDVVDLGAMSVPFNNLVFGEYSSYQPFQPQEVNLQLVDDAADSVLNVVRVELGAFTGDALTAVVVPGGAMLLVGPNGAVVVPAIVTDTEAASEIPGEFALHGNYPNPFNPTTTIRFDLPQTAEVTVEVVDMLGRRVLALPVQTLQAGMNRTIQIEAGTLASGMYLYRVIAKMGAELKVETGRMTLLK